MKLKHVALLKSGESITSSEIKDSGEFPVYGGNGLRGYYSESTHNGHYPLIGRQGALCGNINYARGKFWASEHAIVVQPREGSSILWLGELLRAMNLNQYSVSAAQPGLSVENIGNLFIPVPSKMEMEIIANFLERQTAKIDNLISKQQRLMRLLQEKRQAVISHAVTRGINPGAPMKDSGVEWLGMVPDHWRVERIATSYSERVEAGKQDLPILSVSIHHGISDKELSADELYKKVNHIEDKTKYKRVYPNDIAYNMMRAWQGGFGAVQVEGLVSPAYVIAKPKDERSAVDSQYLERVFRTGNCIEEMRRFSKGITDFRSRLYWENFRILRVPVPPPDEQKQILAWINETEKKTDNLISKSLQAIELLKERRTALISAAVTGKIDVRNA